jgi:hypothetical protein
MTTVYEELHDLVDRLPEGDAAALLRDLRARQIAELRRIVSLAPYDDEPVSEDEERGAAEARAAYARGDVQPLVEFWEELRRERRSP